MVVKINKPGWKNIPGGDPRNPLGDKWLGITVNSDKGRTYGIHGTNNPSSIGSHASSGCIRMGKENLNELYSLIPEGTPVWIHSGNSKGSWQGDPSFAVQPTNGKVKVTVDQANVRTGPSTGAFVISQEKIGTIFEVTGFVKDWVQVKHPSGKVGYLHKSVYEKVSGNTSPTPSPDMNKASGTVTITASTANIRSSTSLNAPVVQKAKKGTKLTLIGENKEWFQVRLSNGYTAYVHKTVAQKATSTPSQPATGKQLTVTVNLANIRTSPSLKATIKQRVVKGTKLNQVGVNGEWYVIQLADKSLGFVHNSTVR
ncbi:SH3 domain-containing protein [Hazenella coriacea]|uniref:SH3 domain-containing protein n=2 Tax=Hazenella coriacea TaxID=1179467 RepID=A0A4R3L1I8_9BACL|nr:SH3 domain-containing protein [Hazenella coriacea]